MIIECPTCHARAKLADSKEGAKVRCGECGRVYVAREPGAAGRRTSSSAALPIGLAAGGALVFGLILYMSGSGKDDGGPVAAEPAAPTPEPLQDETGWSSELVQLVATIHDVAWTRDEGRLAGLLDFPRVWAWRNAPAADAEAADVDPRPWADLDADARRAFETDVVQSLTVGPDKDEIAAWKPFDGEVVLEDGPDAVVRVAVAHRDPTVSAETRHIEWKLVHDGRRWKAWSWERFYSEAERKAQRVHRSRITQKRTLSDGSVVIEAEPGPLEHYPETSPEMRARIEAAYERMIDPEHVELDPKESARAMAELVEIGRPALPVLLTGLYEIPLDTELQAMQVNLINQALESITGFYTGYKPQVAQGSGTGTSQERRESAIKQWFGWWYRKGQKFQEDTNPDLLEAGVDLDAMSERERREYEKAVRQAAEEERARQREKP